MSHIIDLTKFNLKYACKVHDLMDCPFCGLTEEQLEKRIAGLEGNVKMTEIDLNVKNSGGDGSQNYINLMGQEDCLYSKVPGGINDFKIDVNESEMGEVKQTYTNLLEISDDHTDVLNQLLRIFNDTEEFEKPHESTINIADLWDSEEDAFQIYFNSMEQGGCEQGDQKREDAQNCFNSMEQGVCEQDSQKRDKYVCLTSTISEASNVGANFGEANQNYVKKEGEGVNLGKEPKNNYDIQEVYGWERITLHSPISVDEEHTPASNLHFSSKSVNVFNKTVSEIVGDIEVYSVVENCNHSKLQYPLQFQKSKIKPKINFDEILVVEIGEDTQAHSATENRIKVQYPLQFQRPKFQQPKFKPEFNPNEILKAQIQNGTSENLFETSSQSLNQIKLGTKRPASEPSESCGVKRVKTTPSVLKNRGSEPVTPLNQKKNCSLKDPIRSELDQFLYAKSKASLSENEARRGSATLKSMVYNHFNFDNVCNNLCNSSLRDVKNAIKRQGQLLLNLGNIFFSPCFGQNLKEY